MQHIGKRIASKLPLVQPILEEMLEVKLGEIDVRALSPLSFLRVEEPKYKNLPISIKIKGAAISVWLSANMVGTAVTVHPYNSTIFMV